jgi:hypothetical protein
MEQPIIVKYRWSAEDLIQGYRYYWRHICRPIVRIGLHFIIAIFAITGVLALLHYYGILHYANHRESSPILPIGLIVVGFYWFILRRFDFRWTIRRRYAKRPDKDTDMEWEMAPGNISVRSCLSYSEFSWKMLVKTVRTPSGLMLYTLEHHFVYLPRRGFAGEAEFEKAVALAKSQVPRFYTVR